MRIALGSEELDDGGFEWGFGESHWSVTLHQTQCLQVASRSLGKRKRVSPLFHDSIISSWNFFRASACGGGSRDFEQGTSLPCLNVQLSNDSALGSVLSSGELRPPSTRLP